MLSVLPALWAIALSTADLAEPRAPEVVLALQTPAPVLAGPAPQALREAPLADLAGTGDESKESKKGGIGWPVWVAIGAAAVGAAVVIVIFSQPKPPDTSGTAGRVQVP